MSGSATLVRWLLANGLLDQLNLLVHPIVLGKGQRLFEDAPPQPLRLVSQETFNRPNRSTAVPPADPTSAWAAARPAAGSLPRLS